MFTLFQPFPVLTTPRLLLRRIQLSDDKEIFFQRTDALMNQYIDRPPTNSIDEAREWINKINKNIDANESIFWGIALKENDTLIGGFCFWNLSKENSSAEIGFGIHPEHWRKGLMQEALTEGLRFGFEQMELQTVEAYTHPDNAGSVKLLEKNGFTLKAVPDIKPGNFYAIFTLAKINFNP